jgi:hypothetical protein
MRSGVDAGCGLTSETSSAREGIADSHKPFATGLEMAGIRMTSEQAKPKKTTSSSYAIKTEKLIEIIMRSAHMQSRLIPGA